MPTYEYQCLDCGRKVEYFQYISEAPVEICSACNGRLTRLVSAGAGLIFKGSGFYITDYKKSNGSVTPSHVEKSPPAAESAAPVSTEKPAASVVKSGE